MSRKILRVMRRPYTDAASSVLSLPSRAQNKVLRPLGSDRQSLSAARRVRVGRHGTGLQDFGTVKRS